ncbi:MAG: SDR family NAD(P)-dependent oxidoreductase, partial [Pseudomonadota bacterium]|nr:SDR family NAD(P)-dependent oxidoreductase [Pseudomonadota bacterium]
MAQRIALVTGGMGGLGEAICTKLADQGYRVLVTHSPHRSGAAEWVADMAKRGYDFRAYEVDVGDFDSCQEMVARIESEVGNIDMLINNAGITKDTTFKKMTKVDWNAVVNTNLN